MNFMVTIHAINATKQSLLVTQELLPLFTVESIRILKFAEFGGAIVLIQSYKLLPSVFVLL